MPVRALAALAHAAGARSLRTYGLAARVVESDLEDTFNTSSSWVRVTRDAHWLDAPQIKPAAALITARGARVWTDDFSDLIEYLR